MYSGTDFLRMCVTICTLTVRFCVTNFPDRQLVLMGTSTGSIMARACCLRVHSLCVACVLLVCCLC